MNDRLMEPPVWQLSHHGQKDTTLADAISDEIWDFAKGHDLKLIERHQDQPLWYLVQDVPMVDNWTRSTYVQVGTFASRHGPESVLLKASPGARMVNEVKAIARVMAAPPESSNVEITRADDIEALEQKIGKLLEKVWRAALKLDPLNTSFKEEVLPS